MYIVGENTFINFTDDEWILRASMLEDLGVLQGAGKVQRCKMCGLSLLSSSLTFPPVVPPRSLLLFDRVCTNKHSEVCVLERLEFGAIHTAREKLVDKESCKIRVSMNR